MQSIRRRTWWGLAAAAAFGWLVLAGAGPAHAVQTIAGDCDMDGETGIVELQQCINIFTGTDPSACSACDPSQDLEVSIIDLQGDINCYLDFTSLNCPTFDIAGDPTPTPTSPPSCPFAGAPIGNVTFNLAPGGGTCSGVCSGGANNGKECFPASAAADCPGGTCANRTCKGGPLNAQTCGDNSSCNACTMTPPQGSCSFLQTKATKLGLAISGTIGAEIGTPDPVTCVAPITIPKESQKLDPVEVTGVGIACVTLTADGSGQLDCDGGSPNINLSLTQDHNTTPGNAKNLMNSTNMLGLPDDMECDDTSPFPGGIGTSSACLEGSECDDTSPAVHPGACNSPIVAVTSGEFAPGDATISLPTQISVIQAGQGQEGPDGKPCTDDDTPGIVTSSTVGLTTGQIAIRIFDTNNAQTASGLEISPGLRNSCTVNTDCPRNGAAPPDEQECFNNSTEATPCGAGPCSCRVRCGARSCLALRQGVGLSCQTLKDTGSAAGTDFTGGFPSLDLQPLGDNVITLRFLAE